MPWRVTAKPASRPAWMTTCPSQSRPMRCTSGSANGSQNFDFGVFFRPTVAFASVQALRDDDRLTIATDASALDKQVATQGIAGHILGAFLGLFFSGRSGGGDLAVRFAITGCDAHNADGKRRQGLKMQFPAPILRHIAAAQALLDAEQAGHRFGEGAD